MTAQSKSLVIYEIAKGKKIEVPIEKETVWLTQKQMSELFGKNLRTINDHLSRIFQEKELVKKSVIRKFRITAPDGKAYINQVYNLDVIISVGYRVKSLRGTQFRIWATKTLRDYILKGYAVNKHRLIDTGIDELERAVNLIRQTLDSKVLTGSEAKGILKVITDYAHSWILFHKYDEGHIDLKSITKPVYVLTYESALGLITQLADNLHSNKVATKFVGMERDDHGLERIIGSINQTYNGIDLYTSVEEKAAHMLYFVIKDHPLIDGNKRSGSLLFIHFLAQNGLLFRDSGERTINDNTIVALALLISQSHPNDKEIMIRLISNLLT
jgi:prophage maintenance system killer protein/transcriptional regulator CtsR